MIGENKEMVLMYVLKNTASYLKDSYRQLDISLTHKTAAQAQYGDGDLIRLVNLGLIAVFSKYMLTSNSGKL